MSVSHTVVVETLLFTILWNSSFGLPVLTEMASLGEDQTNNSALLNESLKNYYVVKAVVYEIGILTDASEDDNTTSSETQERVDLTFFNAHSNDTHIDLGQIPLPVQTNISGQVLTALAPVNIGAFSNPAELLETLPLTGTIINITHSDSALFQIKTSNLTEDEEPHLITQEDIAMIPDFADVLPEVSQDGLDLVREVRKAKEKGKV